MEDICDIFSRCSTRERDIDGLECDELREVLPMLKSRSMRRQPSRNCKSEGLKVNSKLLKAARDKLQSTKAPEKITVQKPTKWHQMMTTNVSPKDLSSILKPYIKYANSLLAYFTIVNNNVETFKDTGVENAIELYNHIIDNKDFIVKLSKIDDADDKEEDKTFLQEATKTKTETGESYSLPLLKKKLYYKNVENIWPIYNRVKSELKSKLLPDPEDEEMTGGSASKSVIMRLHRKYTRSRQRTGALQGHATR